MSLLFPACLHPEGRAVLATFCTLNHLSKTPLGGSRRTIAEVAVELRRGKDSDFENPVNALACLIFVFFTD